jgi:anion-transporting  ArsA/GET3 family ATPase
VLRPASEHELVVVVGGGGVGKTTVAAALGVDAARRGSDTLVMTFDPSRRLKDALGVGPEASHAEVPVALDASGRLDASLLDARDTFDRVVARHAPDPAAARRVLQNPFYRHLSGGLAGVLEYMAVERLFEVWRTGRYRRVILDTPPTRQALDFLEAPERVVRFLASGAAGFARTAWFDRRGRFRPTADLGILGRGLDAWVDRVVGLDLLREMNAFFRDFEPLFAGFQERAVAVRDLLRAEQTTFLLVAAPMAERAHDALFFARRLIEGGYRLGPVIVNRVHPRAAGAPVPGLELMDWLGERDAAGLELLEQRLGPTHAVVPLPLQAGEPTGLADLAHLGEDLSARLAAVARNP